MNRATAQLLRGLSLVDTTALVIGTVIGTGVFLKAAPMAQAVGSPALVLLAWVAAGLLSLAGALTYAELGAMIPLPLSVPALRFFCPAFCRSEPFGLNATLACLVKPCTGNLVRNRLWQFPSFS